MSSGDIAKLLAEKIEDVRIDESMANHTSFKAGGKADIMVLPKSRDEIKHVLDAVAAHSCPLFVTGRGTNLLVTSGGIRGVVMKLADNWSGVEIEGEYVTAKSGTPLSTLVREAASRSLGNAEFLGGIPGTLGGAVYMNAGAYGGETGDFIEEVYLISGKAEIILSKDEMGFGYRKSILKSKDMIVVEAKLKLERCSPDESRKRLAELNRRRRDKQPLEFPSAGSTFKRPEGHYAGTLIEKAGLKGFKLGGAEVSEKHAGFIINRGEATPEDIIALIEEVQRRVILDSGIKLEPEVKIVGER